MEFRDLKDYIHLKSVARKLWESRPYGNVALMVGAGFSRNAIHRSDEKQKMAAWGGVVDRMLEELHPSNNSILIQDRAQFHACNSISLNYTKRNSGRSKLFNLIRDLLRDNIIFTANCIAVYFELPWKDIFTTNYDTLLEEHRVALRQN
ncbi:MAG: hypothetical protein IPP17_31430 [Bacteroidetes bacterium]|nr:hypothetical protein [Bacteroidota bacterium]